MKLINYKMGPGNLFRTSAQLVRSSSAAVIDTDAQAFSNALTVPLTTNRLTLVSNLITGLKADGVWTLIDRLALLANETAESALRDVNCHCNAFPHIHHRPWIHRKRNRRLHRYGRGMERGG
jgi:hypothetical protein